MRSRRHSSDRPNTPATQITSDRFTEPGISWRTNPVRRPVILEYRRGQGPGGVQACTGERPLEMWYVWISAIVLFLWSSVSTIIQRKRLVAFDSKQVLYVLNIKMEDTKSCRDDDTTWKTCYDVNYMQSWKAKRATWRGVVAHVTYRSNKDAG